MKKTINCTNITRPCAGTVNNDIAIESVHEVVEHIGNSGETFRAGLRYQTSNEGEGRCRARSKSDRTCRDGSDHDAIHERLETQGAELYSDLGRVGDCRVDSEMNASRGIIRRQIEGFDDDPALQAIETCRDFV